MVSSSPTDSPLGRTSRSVRLRPARFVASTLIVVTVCAAYLLNVRPANAPTSAAPALPTAIAEQVDLAAKSPQPTQTIRAAAATQTAAARTADAQARLDEAASRLAQLASLVVSPSDADGLQRAVADAARELQQATDAQQAHRHLREQLASAQQDPAHLTAAAPDYVASQPTLHQLIQSLAAAESRLSQLLMNKLPDHPQVQLCRWEQEDLRAQLRNELGATLNHLRDEQTRLDAQVESLTRQSTDAAERLRQVTAASAEYNSLAALVQQRTSDLEQARNDLAKISVAADSPPNPLPVLQHQQASDPTPDQSHSRTLLVATAIAGGLCVAFGLHSLRRARISGTPAAPATLAAPGSPPAPATPAAPPAPAPGRLTTPEPPQPARGTGVLAPQKASGLTLTQALTRLGK